MPRVPDYQGDRVQTRARPTIRRQAPGADAFGGQVGVALERIGPQVAAIYEEQQKRADQLTLVDGKRSFNQLYQVQALGDDRGPSGTRGLLTMQGMDPYTHLQQNLEDWDAQAQEIVKQAKTPRQQALLEAMREDERARYVEQGQRHASVELEKYEVQSRAATRASAKDTAAAAVGTVGFEDIVANQLQAQAAIVNSTPGLAPEVKQRINDEDRSQTHVAVLNRLLDQGQDLAATAYWDRVTATSAAYPQGEILESHAGAIRNKLEVNSTDGEGNRIAVVLFDKLGPKDADDPIDLVAMGKEARAMATRGGQFNLKVYNRAMDYLKVQSAEWQATQKGIVDGHVAALDEAVARGMPLAQLQQLPAWANVSGSLKADILDKYEARARQKKADARADHNWGRSLLNEPYEDLARGQQVREMRGAATYYNLMFNPEQLASMDRPAVQAQVRELSYQQQAQVLGLHQQIAGNVQASGRAAVDNDTFKRVAFENGLTWVYDTSLDDDQKRQLGALRSAVEQEVGAAQQGMAGKSGTRVTLDTTQQEQVIRGVMDRKVLTPGWWGFGMNTVIAATVKKDQLGVAYVPWEQITEESRKTMRAHIRGQPTAGQVRQLSDQEIDLRFKDAMTRAMGIAAAVRDPTAWESYLEAQVQAYRPPSPARAPHVPRTIDRR